MPKRKDEWTQQPLRRIADQLVETFEIGALVGAIIEAAARRLGPTTHPPAPLADNVIPFDRGLRGA